MKAKLFVSVLLALAAAVTLMTCNTSSVDVTMAFSDSQNGLAKSTWVTGNTEWVFPVYFSKATSAATEVSTGHANGATVISITATSNVAFRITGVRMEQVVYRPGGASSEIGYVHPTYGPINPFFLELTGGAVIKVDPGTPAVFDVDLATPLSLWQTMDTDNNLTAFPADQTEAISVSASLFFQGYMLDGTEFSGQFPPPLKLYFKIQHKAA